MIMHKYTVYPKLSGKWGTQKSTTLYERPPFIALFITCQMYVV